MEDKIFQKTNRVLSITIGLLLLAEVIIIVSQVIFRGILKFPLHWTEELARYIMIWMAFLGAGVVIANGENVIIDIVTMHLRSYWKLGVSLAADLLSMVFVVYILKGSLEIIAQPALDYQLSPAMQLNVRFVYAAMPVGCVFMVLFLLRNAVARLGGFFRPERQTGTIKE